MASIWETTYSALSGLGEELAANVMLRDTAEALPDRYIVYQVVSSPPVQAADEAETLRYYRVQVTLYDRAGLTSTTAIKNAMTAAGFRKSVFRELPYNVLTRHYGFAMEFNFLVEE